MYEVFNKSVLKDRRKELRKSLTPQELKCWFYLKSNNLGVKFRRQQGIGPYITDFYCKEKNLVIEIDSSQHMGNKEYDQERDQYIESLGIKVLRFWNNEIDKNIEGVLMKVKEQIYPENFAPPAKGSWRKAPEG